MRKTTLVYLAISLALSLSFLSASVYAQSLGFQDFFSWLRTIFGTFSIVAYPGYTETVIYDQNGCTYQQWQCPSGATFCTYRFTYVSSGALTSLNQIGCIKPNPGNVSAGGYICGSFGNGGYTSAIHCQFSSYAASSSTTTTTQTATTSSSTTTTPAASNCVKYTLNGPTQESCSWSTGCYFNIACASGNAQYYNSTSSTWYYTSSGFMPQNSNNWQFACFTSVYQQGNVTFCPPAPAPTIDTGTLSTKITSLFNSFICSIKQMFGGTC